MKVTKCTLLLLVVIGMTTVGSAYGQFAISGVVTDPLAQPVPNTAISLFDEFGGPIGIPPIVTDMAGSYTINGLSAGTFGVGFEPPSGTGLLGTVVTPVVVTGNTTVDVQLISGAILSGFVRDTLGTGIFDIDLNVYDQVTGSKLTLTGDNTDITGFYSVTIPNGFYRLRWRSVGVGALPWIPVEIESVTVFGSTAVDVTMVLGTTVSGTITNNVGTPILGTDLDFIDVTTGLALITPGDKTDAFGQYSVVVPLGVYDVQAEPLVIDKLVAQEQFSVSVTGDRTLNFTLQPGISISGTVTNNLFVPVSGTDLDVKDALTGDKLLTPYDNTDASGQYEIIVPAGTFNLIYQPLPATMLAPLELSSVTIGVDTVIDVILEDGLLFTGTVQNSLAVGIPNVDIDARSSTTGQSVPLSGDNTDASGLFSVVMPFGLHDIDFEPAKTTHIAARRLFDVPFNLDTAVIVTLDTGMVVSGSVQDSNGLPVTDVNFVALDNVSGDTVLTPADHSDLFGNYNVLLAIGVYDLYWIADSLSPITDTIVQLAVTISTDVQINVAFSSVLPACCVDRRGNVDNIVGPAGPIDVSDLTYLVGFLFKSGPPPPCTDEGNVDGVIGPAGPIDVSDLTYLVSFLFKSGAQPPLCL